MYVYTSVAGEWSLLQTLNGTTDSYFGSAVAYSPSGTQLAIGADGVNSATGMWMYGRADACKW